MAVLTVISLGTGDPNCLTREAERLLRETGQVVLRTERSPLAGELRKDGVSFDSLDSLYEECEDFDLFNHAAAVALLTLLRQGDVCYVVGDAAFDSTVFTLQRLKGAQDEIRILPGVGLADCCLSLVKRGSGKVRVMAAIEWTEAADLPEEALLLCELHSRECAGDCKLKLMRLTPDETIVTLIAGDEETGRLEAREISLVDLDRQPRYDHLTAVYVPPTEMDRRDKYNFDDLVRVMARLRRPDGCPWDREQTYESLLPHLLEESYEYIQAVKDDDPEHMCDELGDVLLQVAFHAQIASQHGDFDILDVCTAICRKMIERHPHIFGGEPVEDATRVSETWEEIKRRQRGISCVSQAMKDVSKGLSPLLRAAKVLKKAEGACAETWPLEEAIARAKKKMDILENALRKGSGVENALGEALLAIAQLAGTSGQDADLALYQATEELIQRFEKAENAIKCAGKRIEDLTLSEMVVYLDLEKQAGQRSPQRGQKMQAFRRP